MTTTTAAIPTPTPTGAVARGNTLTGAGALIRFNLRRDRVRLPVWVAALTLSTVSTAASFPDLYQSAQDRQARAELISSPAGTAMSGPGYGLDDYTFGAMLSNEMLSFIAIFVALMSVFIVVRHTRTEEETGRAELVRAAIVGRHAHTAAAVVVAVGANVVLATFLAFLLPSMGVESIDAAGSLAFATGLAAVGFVFVGIAAVASQITEHSRGASGIAIAAIGAAFALRAVGDVGNGALSWLSPIGWAQAMRPYVDERWSPLVLALVIAVVLVVTAFALSIRRDVGAGLRQTRPGPRAASQLLGTPFGFALRLQRGALIGWCVGMFVFGIVYGSIVADVEEFVAGNATIQDAVADIGGDTVIDSFLTVIVSMLATVCTIFGILAVQRLRSEETAGRAEPVLATALSRTRWVASHLTMAIAGGTAVLLSSALGVGITAAISTDDAGVLGDLMSAALAYLPAMWISVGVAIALFGLVPRALGLAWAVLVYAIVLTMFGTLLRFPDWMHDLSPFGHVPGMPAEDFSATPLVVLIAITVALVWVGIAGFRRRDLTTN